MKYTKWETPKTQEETEHLLQQAQEFLRSIDEDSIQFDLVIKELALYAGSFNRAITYDQRLRLMQLIASKGQASLRPTLDALVECGRVEQYDVTEAVIHLIYCRK